MRSFLFLCLSLSLCTLVSANNYTLLYPNNTIGQPVGTNLFSDPNSWTTNGFGPAGVIPGEGDNATNNDNRRIEDPPANITTIIQGADGFEVSSMLISDPIDPVTGVISENVTLVNEGGLGIDTILQGNGVFEEVTDGMGSDPYATVDTISGPTLNLQNGELVVTGNTTSTVASMTITNFARLDLQENGSLIDGADSISTIRSWLQNLQLVNSELSTNEALGYNTVTGGTLIQSTLIGDTNLDGTVNLTDLLNLLSDYGQPTGGTWGGGDFNYDGAVNLNDLLALLNNYGQTFVATSTQTMVQTTTQTTIQTTVPEPCSVVLIGAAGLMLMRRR